MQEKTEKPDLKMLELLKKRDYLHKIRLGLIPVVSVQGRMLEDIPSVRKKLGGYALYVSTDFHAEMIKKNPTLSRRVY